MTASPLIEQRQGAPGPARFQDPLPPACDVVVVGGGVIGVFAALYLARAGQRVVLCEKGRIAGEQSSRNWGWIRQQGRDVHELPLMIESLALWKDIAAQTGEATGFRRCGVVSVARTAQQLAHLSAFETLAHEHGLDTRLLDPQQAGELLQEDRKPRTGWLGALHTPSDARAEPWCAVPAVARLAQSSGVAVREDCAVRALRSDAGVLTGVVTEHGAVRADRVVLAGGAWSSLFALRHGVNLPQLTVRATASRTAQLPSFHEGAAIDDGLGVRRRDDGGYTIAAAVRAQHLVGRDSFRNAARFWPLLRRSAREIGVRPKAPTGYPDAWGTPRHWHEDERSPFEALRVLDPPADPASVERSRVLFAERFPGIGKPVILDSWAGMIDVTPDVLPLLGPAPGIDGLFVATGMSGHGFGIGPGVGRVIASLARGEPAGHDIRPFRLERFTDGSALYRDAVF